MAQLTDIPQFSAPVWCVIDRLTWHSRPGGILAGMKWHKEGGVRVDGADKLPSLQPIRVSFASLLFAGAPKESNKLSRYGNVPVVNDFILSLGIATDEKHGFVRIDPQRQGARKGLLEWVGLIQDAVETGKDGTVDSRLERTLYKPVGFIMREPDPGELSFSAVLDVLLYSRPHCRGERSYDFPDLDAVTA